MISLQHVVCPVDFSAGSRRALEYAAALASWYEARLTVLHVYLSLPAIDAVPLMQGPAVGRPDVDTARLNTELQEFAALVPSEAPVTLQISEARDVRKGIVEQVGALQPDLLVMGTHGRSGFERLLLGSVTEGVLRKVACPVLTVPPQVEAPAHSGPFKRIVAAVDFSPASLRPLEYAFDLAAEADAEITLLHVIELPPELHDAGIAAGVDVAQIRAAAEARALQRLRDLVPAQARTYCTVRTEVVEGRAHREIVRLAAERHADLIVMGVRGRNALDQLIFGSNTHSVLTSAGCPVLTAG